MLLTPAFNNYIREDLEFETDVRYEILNKKQARHSTPAGVRADHPVLTRQALGHGMPHYCRRAAGWPTGRLPG